MLIRFCQGCFEEISFREKLLFQCVYNHFLDTCKPCLIPDDDEDLHFFRNLEQYELLVTTDIKEYIMIKPKVFPVIGDIVQVCLGNEDE